MAKNNKNEKKGFPGKDLSGGGKGRINIITQLVRIFINTRPGGENKNTAKKDIRGFNRIIKKHL